MDTIIQRQDLTIDELMVLNSELRDAEKSIALAYLMLLGGHLGVHRFYLKRIGTAVVQLVLFILTTISYFMGVILMEFYEPIGIVFIVVMALSGLALLIWIIIDLFLMPRMVKEWNERIEQQILEQIVYYRNMRNQNLS